MGKKCLQDSSPSRSIPASAEAPEEDLGPRPHTERDVGMEGTCARNANNTEHDGPEGPEPLTTTLFRNCSVPAQHQVWSRGSFPP